MIIIKTKFIFPKFDNCHFHLMDFRPKWAGELLKLAECLEMNFIPFLFLPLPRVSPICSMLGLSSSFLFLFSFISLSLSLSLSLIPSSFVNSATGDTRNLLHSKTRPHRHSSARVIFTRFCHKCGRKFNYLKFELC